MWAAAYLQDKFYAGVRTTSRREGINSFIKRYIKSRHSIIELVQQFERAVKDCRNNELVADFSSMNSVPVLTTALKSIERGASNVYTREIFKEVKKEIERHAALYVVDTENIATTVVYKLNKFGKSCCEYNVMYDRNLVKFDCKCYLWNTHGIPCSHIFCVMKYENIEELPENMILKRWTKAAKSYHEPAIEEKEDNSKLFLLRYGALCSASCWMSFLGAKNLLDFLSTRDEICRITNNLERKSCMMEIGSSFVPKDIIGDPVMVKTKGAPPKRKKEKKERHCSKCRLFGHTRRTCRSVEDKESQFFEDDVSSPSSNEDLNVVARTDKKVK